jgi:hypothetical protein
VMVVVVVVVVVVFVVSGGGDGDGGGGGGVGGGGDGGVVQCHAVGVKSRLRNGCDVADTHLVSVVSMTQRNKAIAVFSNHMQWVLSQPNKTGVMWFNDTHLVSVVSMTQRNKAIAVFTNHMQWVLSQPKTGVMWFNDTHLVSAVSEGGLADCKCPCLCHEHWVGCTRT